MYLRTLREKICLVCFCFLFSFCAGFIDLRAQTQEQIRTNAALASAQEASQNYYLQGVEYAAEGKFKEAGEQFSQALELNEFNYDAEVALDIINALNKKTINENYAITTFTSRLVTLKNRKLENLITGIQEKVSTQNEQIENIQKQLTALKTQFDDKIYQLRVKIDKIEEDIDYLKNRGNSL
ncbi:MAG: hypothetical protein PHQ96_07775 [Candidatus Omnitrophica bacterium]|nr:hypothetical protein [Candidatus Omnitrophota bacterium]